MDLRSVCSIVLATTWFVACSSSEDGRVDATAATPSDSGVVDAFTPVDSAVTFPDASEQADAAVEAADAGADAGVDAGVDAGEAVRFQITSSAYREGDVIPQNHTCRGTDLQPALSWTEPPANTASFALVLIDDTFDFVHWVAYNIPATTRMLAEGDSDTMMLPTGTLEANAYCTQFCGPCPPRGPNTYSFRLYALDVATINFTPSGGFGARELLRAFGTHTLEMVTLTGVYGGP